MLVHVVDASSEDRMVNIEQVNKVLEEIEADDCPQIEIYNKIDLMEGVMPHIERDENGRPARVWISAMRDEGMELVLEAVAERLQAERVIEQVCLSPQQGRLHARLYALGAVLHEKVMADGYWLMDLDLPRQTWDGLCKHEALADYILLSDHDPCLAAGGEAQ